MDIAKSPFCKTASDNIKCHFTRRHLSILCMDSPQNLQAVDCRPTLYLTAGQEGIPDKMIMPPPHIMGKKEQNIRLAPDKVAFDTVRQPVHRSHGAQAPP